MLDHQIIEESIEMELMDARAAGTLGFIARALIMAAMPHKEVSENEYLRVNGKFKLSIIAPAAVGIPYGPKPRLILAFICSEAVKTKSREIILGENLSEFLDKLGLTNKGQEISMLKEQMYRLFNSSIFCEVTGQQKKVRGRIGISSKEVYIWDKNTGIPLHESRKKWAKSFILTDEFYRDIQYQAIPIDWRAINELQGSSLALDLYVWLTYRMFELKKSVEIPWERLMVQFGPSYNRLDNFKSKFLIQLKKVNECYPQAKLELGNFGLILHPSPPHVQIKLSTTSCA